ncbi:hypothetical protein GCM10027290_19180 [Micromonospora sonneratiae]|uniref:Uncharacterized protein n=1 Tax=Micromonospora sonneratiae TaxID=1184706 RepID=A0ABW3Y8K9_9ACTN
MVNVRRRPADARYDVLISGDEILLCFGGPPTATGTASYLTWCHLHRIRYGVTAPGPHRVDN